MTAEVRRQPSLNRQDLRNLQILIYWLRLPEWPKEISITRNDVFTLIINLAPSLGVEIDDPHFLDQLDLKISQLLLQQQVASVPSNLKQLVADYEKFLTDNQIEETRNLIRKRIEQLLQNVNPLLQKEENQPILKDAAKQIAEAAESHLPFFPAGEKLPIAVTNQIIQESLAEIKTYLEYIGIPANLYPETVQAISTTMAESLPELETIAHTPVNQRIIAPVSPSLKTKEATLKYLYPTLNKTTQQLHQELAGQIKVNLIATHPELTQAPTASQTISEQVANVIAAILPQTAREKALKTEEYEQALNNTQSVIVQTLSQNGIKEPKINKQTLKELTKKTFPYAQKIATLPHVRLKFLPSETKEAALKASFVHYDQPTAALYQQLEEKIQTNLQTIDTLRNNPLAQKVVAERVGFALLSQTPPLSVSQTITQELKRIGFELPSQKTISQTAANINQQIESEVATLTTTARTFITLPEFLETEKMAELSTKAKKITQAENILAQKISFELKAASPNLATNPKLTQTLSQEIKDVVAGHLFSLPQKTITTPEYEQLLTTALPEINTKLTEKGISFQSEQVRALIKKITETSQTEAALLTGLGEPILPQTVVNQLAKTTDSVAFQPIYTILNPKLTWAYFKKIALTPAKLIISASADQATPEWQEMIKKGLFAEDIQASLTALKEAGLPETHPTFISFKEKLLLASTDQNTLAAKILKHYYEYDKLTGQHQIYEPKLKTYLPRLSPPPVWSKLTGFPWRLRQTFNEIGLKLKIFQRIETGPGKYVVRFILPDKIIRFFTFGRFQTLAAFKGAVNLKISQGLAALAKTGFGQAIKKGATWVATKLGVKAAVTAAVTATGAATGPPGWLVAIAVQVLSFIGKKILRPIFDKLKQIIKEPEKALGLIGIGAVAMVFLPMPIALVGIVPITLGGLGLLSAGISGAGTIASSFATGVATFFTTLTTLPITAVSALLIVGTIAGLSAATFFIVITTAGAFILPTAPEIAEPTTIGEKVAPRSPSEAGHLAETVIYTLNQCGITLVNQTTWSKTVTCIQNSSLPNKQTIIDQFHYSVWDVGPGLQCVGFVRGVMDALGRDPGGGYQARDYASRPEDNFYYAFNSNIQEVQVGDLVIMLGGSYGHIGIVVLKSEDIIRVAQAWGFSRGGSGLLQITELNLIYFDGFLRPK